MSLGGFIILLIIAGVCGGLGAGIGGYSHAGCLGSILLGFVGAALGMFIAASFHLPSFFTLRISGYDFPVLWSIVGSALLVAILGMLRARSPRG